MGQKNAKDNFDILITEQMLEKENDVVEIPDHIPKIEYQDISVSRKLEDDFPSTSNAVTYVCSVRGEKYAFKCFRIPFGEVPEVAFPPKEVLELSHPNLVKFHWISSKSPRLGSIYEYIKEGNIKKFFKENPNKLGVDEKLRMLFGLADVLHVIGKAIHPRIIRECELWDKKVFIQKVSSSSSGDGDDETEGEGEEGEKYIIKVRNVNIEFLRRRRMFFGDDYLFPPEIGRGEGYVTKSTVYMFGMLCYCIMTENFDPYSHRFEKENNYIDRNNLIFKVSVDPSLRPDLDDLKKKITSEKDEWFANMIQKCWEADAELRPSFDEILDAFVNHGFGEKEKE